MAELKARIGDAVTKINDKLRPSGKRRFPTEESGNGQPSKQLRTVAGHASSSSQTGAGHPLAPQSTSPFSMLPADTAGYPSLEKPPPSSSSSGATTSYTWDPSPKHSRASSRFPSTSGSGTSSATYPVELANSTPSSSPRSYISPEDPSSAATASQMFRASRDNRMQLSEDERLASALKEEGLPRRGPSNHTSKAFLDVDAFRCHLHNIRCSQCRADIPVSWAKIATRTETAIKEKGTLHPFLQCTKCKVWSCAGAGCQEYRETVTGLEPSASIPGLTIAWCCDGGRLFLIFCLACGTECPTETLSTSGFRRRTRFKSDPLPQKQKTTDLLSTISQLEYASSQAKAILSKASKPKSVLSKGTGYGGAETQPQHTPAHPFLGPTLPTMSTNLPVPKPEDRKLAVYLQALNKVLPSSSCTNHRVFNSGHQPVVGHMMARSPILNTVSELLRQTCVEEIVSLAQVYLSLLVFLTALTNHKDLDALFVKEMVLYPRESQLGPSMFSSFNPISHVASSSANDTTTSLNILLQTLGDHCSHFVRTASAHLNQIDQDGGLTMKLVNQIIQTADKLSASRPKLAASYLEHPYGYPRPPPQTSSVRTRGQVARAAIEAQLAQQRKADAEMASFHRENCVQDLPDDTILESFYFATRARDVEALKQCDGRMKKLAMQISSLRSGLPQGIYVRHGTSRLDVMKVLIVGPSGTPYEDGLFEFDFFCNERFPLMPPEVQFRTTGGGKIGFNPNLYNNGKVCLSLIGTWTGQGWEPQRSTILQVLVSIQAMILTNEPWYNEPGRETRTDTVRSEAYNCEIYQYTIRHAMIYWLNERLCIGDNKGRPPVRTTATGTPSPSNKPVPSTATHPQNGSTLSALPQLLSMVTSAVQFPGPDPDIPPWDEPGLQQTQQSQIIEALQDVATYASAELPVSLSSNVGGHPIISGQSHPGSNLAGQPPSFTNSSFFGHSPDSLLHSQVTALAPNIAQVKSVQALQVAVDDPWMFSSWQAQNGQTGQDGQGGPFASVPGPGIATGGPPSNGPRDSGPIGNTAVDSKDDAVWGLVIRKHFGHRSAHIVDRVSSLPYPAVKAAKSGEQELRPPTGHYQQNQNLADLMESLRKRGFAF